MAQCEECGKYENLPYRCRRCGGTFCGEHRLPENHDCPGLQEWNDPGGVFDSGFDDGVENRDGRAKGFFDGLTATGGFFGYFRGNMSYVFLGLMWVTFILEYVVGVALTGVIPHSVIAYSQIPTWTDIFLLSPNPSIAWVWTWFTSIFAHASWSHIIFNSIPLFFFGPLVERYIGSRKFTALFLISGGVAAFSQIALSTVTGHPAGVLGASGAIMAVLGVLTVLKPDLEIYVFFLIRIPLWLFTIGFAAVSIFFIASPLGGDIANFAHLTGLVIGLAYGQQIKGNQRIPDQVQFGGARRGGGRGPF